MAEAEKSNLPDAALGEEQFLTGRLQPWIRAYGWVPWVVLGWLVIFGTYEVIERNLLHDLDPAVLRYLHILRGTLTSFLLAGLVAWYLLRAQSRPQAEVPLLSSGLRTIAIETEAKELEAQAMWIVHLRWIAIAGVISTALVSHFLVQVISQFSAVAIFLVAMVMLAYNSVFTVIPRTQLATLRAAFAQVLLDLIALTLMIYFTGGVQNPFFLFYIFHVVIAGILLGKGETYFIAFMACVFFCGSSLLQQWELIPSFPLRLGPSGDEFNWITDLWQLSGVLVAFTATIGCTAYFTTTIMDKLRRRGTQILEAGEILMQERAKTEDIVRSVGAGLLVLDRERRIIWANEIARRWFGEGLESQLCHARLWQSAEPCRSCPMPQAATLEASGTCECSIVLNGKRRFFLISSTPVRSTGGMVDQVLELIQDVTPLKEMEIQLVQSGKMAAVGQLASGIAHEINNPLAIVASSAEILAEQMAVLAPPGPGGETLRRHLKRIEENVFRSKEIIQNLLRFARREDEGWEEVDLGALLDETIRLVEGSTRARERTIRREYGPHGGGRVVVLRRSRPRYIQQIFLNLLLNALDATEKGGWVAVRTEPHEGGIDLIVADNGKGIAPEQLAHIFEPFFTTKPVGQGTGLGLYLCQQFANALNGSVAAENVPAQGALLRVWLPLDSSSAEGAQAPVGQTRESRT